MIDSLSFRLDVGTIIDGKYRLERPLARGGMGSVWVARHIALDEPVAIKLLSISREDLDDAEVRLQREAKSTARLRSPHIVQLLDYGVDREVPFIVMELLEGEHLGTRLRRKGRLSLAGAAVLLEQVGRALRRVHKAGIVHRDLKPANIFLARSDDEEIVKLLDFGIVKAPRGTLSGDATESNVLIGSPNYMSPEQTLSAKDIDHRSDLWSLAVILFEVVTGRMAFSGGSIVSVLMNIRNGPIPVPGEIAPDLPAEVDMFFRRALQRDPAQRFSSAREMTAEFSAMVKRIGPRAEATGAPLLEERGSLLDVSSADFLSVLTEITVSPESASGSRVPDLIVSPSVAAPLAPPPLAPPRPRVSPPRESTPYPNREASLPPEPFTPTARSPSSPELDEQGTPRRATQPSPGALAKRDPVAPAPTGRSDVEDAAEPPLEAQPQRKSRASASMHPAGSIAELVDLGFFALRAGNREWARKCWAEALARDPSNRALELNLHRLEAKLR
jgi:eukaryotic-like serine/threonine-protein kinase